MSFFLLILGKKRISYGFTLIELLVVVAIIGLLASIAVTAAMIVRDKAKSSRIEAEVSQVRAQAVMIKNSDDSFAGLCDAGNTLNETVYPNSLGLLETDIMKTNGSKPVNCYASTDAYCVQSPLVPNGGYCVDSTGYAGRIANCASGHISCQ